ncbi:MAG: helicase-related protein, partial [Desulforhabdus sp.]|nr:helicase-related protein [Desulforhabdus sp.]
RFCEKFTHLLNQDEPAPIAYAHHGSLAREIRTEVEKKLKAGDLRAIVATSSLELGIDIGALDEVVLIQSAPTFSAAIQRIGRAGHGVGEVSRGTLMPVEPKDILQDAVLAAGVVDQEIESVQPVQSPLDVLAQIIVSMVGMEAWQIDQLYARLKTSYSYRALSRQQFDLVIDMLAGRYAGSRLRELKPRIAVDRLSNTVSIRKGALQDLYFSGGTIPDRGYFHLRHLESGARIGELDEEFVWEARIGQTFTLSTQNWRIERITHNDVLVLPAHPGTAAPPFWKAEESLRSFHMSERIGLLLETADDRLKEPQFKQHLKKYHFLSDTAAKQLIAFLQRQKEETGCSLPHRRHLLIEHVHTGPGGYPGNQIVLHTIWGGRVNRPFAMALEAAWEESYGYQPQIYTSNDCVMLQLPHDVRGDEIVALVSSSSVQSLLKKSLEGSGFFGARFRECAGRSLLLTRRKMNERMPLWLSRLRSQKLLESVLQYDDFPILLEAWRTCLQEELDLKSLGEVLSELEAGEIAWSEADTSHPSPMAQSLTWPQINQYMYMDDELGAGKASRLRSDLLQEVVLSPELRPAVPIELSKQFELKRQRLAPGYAPDSSLDLIEWVKERLLLPFSEWQRLLSHIESDHGINSEALLKEITHRLAVVHAPGANEPLIAATEELPRIIFGFYGTTKSLSVESFHPQNHLSSTHLSDQTMTAEDREAVFLSLLSQWLQYYSPKTVEQVARTLGLDREQLATAVEDLADSESLVMGLLLRETAEELVCDRENYEILLRLMRAQARPPFEPLDLELLPLFLAKFQGITEPEKDMDGLFRRLEQLVCWAAGAELWEAEILPTRMQSYDPSWLDSILQQSDLGWIGCGKRRVSFCFEGDLDLMQEEAERDGSKHLPSGLHKSSRSMASFQENQEPGLEQASQSSNPGYHQSVLAELFPDSFARYDFTALVRISNLNPAELSKKLWDGVWKGEVTNDTFASLRRGIENNFKVTDLTQTRLTTAAKRRRLSARVAFSMWTGSLPLAGNWLRVPWPEHEDDLIEREERNKDKARLLLDRYGILFKELLRNELPAFGWSKIFRALRLMELSGEVLTGYFFHGVPGPQFISRQAFRTLQKGLPKDAIYWIATTDPASLCGMRLNALKGKLARRTVGTHLVYHGSRLVLESRRNGKTLVFHVPADDRHLQSYLELLHHLLNRKFQRMRSIVVEQINGTDAAQSPYVHAFRAAFHVNLDFKNLVLYRRYSPAR